MPFEVRPAHKMSRAAKLRWALRVGIRATAVSALCVTIGFLWFLSQVEADEQRLQNPSDGIVVLTGGSSRVADAVTLLANGYGKRLLISGVHWSNGTVDISRSLPENKAWLDCCVDLDHSAVNTRSNATETRRWVEDRQFRSLIVVTSNYHMPRAIVELSHAMPDVLLTPFPVIGDKWHEEPWWSSGAAAKLLAFEYAKYLVAAVRVHLDDWTINPDDVKTAPTTTARKPATAAAN
jgi:uncharacterized SAM-binding protein YcdF (DUF218 family)